MHSYARKVMEDQLGVIDKLLDSEGPPVDSSPETLSQKPPSKKSKTQVSEEDEQPELNSRLLSAMERVERMQEESLRWLRSLETTVIGNTDILNSVTDSLTEFLRKQVEDVTTKADNLKARVETLEKENITLHKKCNDLDAYKRRWNI